jgi:hypothetical protein
MRARGEITRGPFPSLPAALAKHVGIVEAGRGILVSVVNLNQHG